MSIKLILLKSGETLISDAKEIVSKEKEIVIGYILNNPHKVSTNNPIIFLSEDENFNSKDKTVEITLSPWILLTSSDDIPVSTDWVVTVVNPIDSVQKLYEEKVNGN